MKENLLLKSGSIKTNHKWHKALALNNIITIFYKLYRIANRMSLINGQTVLTKYVAILFYCNIGRKKVVTKEVFDPPAVFMTPTKGDYKTFGQEISNASKKCA